MGEEMAERDRHSSGGGAAPTTVRLQNVAQSYGQSAALMAAVEIGVFTAISNGAGSYAEVARAVDIHPTNAERLMVMLCAAARRMPIPLRHFLSHAIS
jgi:transcriptional regulator GlxA family with amidase domain